MMRKRQTVFVSQILHLSPLTLPSSSVNEELADLKGSDARVLSKKEKKLEAQNGGKKFQMQKSRGGDSERLPDHGVERPRAHKHKGSHVTEGKRGKKRKILLGTLLQPLFRDMLASHEAVQTSASRIIRVVLSKN
ncbi:hypothetical protein ACTXT7_005089 [Hymenolepis weldensis]